MTVYGWSIVFLCAALAFLLAAHFMRSDYMQGSAVDSNGNARLRAYGFHPFLALASMGAVGMGFALSTTIGETSLVVMSLAVAVFCLAMHYESAYSVACHALDALERLAQTPNDLTKERDALKKTVSERDIEIANLKGQIEGLSKGHNIISIDRPAPRSTPATG